MSAWPKGEWAIDPGPWRPEDPSLFTIEHTLSSPPSMERWAGVTGESKWVKFVRRNRPGRLRGEVTTPDLAEGDGCQHMESADRLFPECPSCGMATLHPGEQSGWTCWNCGAAPESALEMPTLALAGSVYECRWCSSTSTRLVSEPGRTARGVWQVFHCGSCGATHARYIRSD
jgi:ribosomal protein L37AE/L43A